MNAANGPAAMAGLATGAAAALPTAPPTPEVVVEEAVGMALGTNWETREGCCTARSEKIGENVSLNGSCLQ